MANKFATNFPIPSATNVFATIWKLTRVMKAAGWTYKASSNGFLKDTSSTATNDTWGGNADPMTDTYTSNGIFTTITTGFTLTSATTSITVGSTSGFPSSGTLYITIASATGTPNGTVAVPYTAIISSTTFAISYSGSSTVIATGANVGPNFLTLDATVAWIVLAGPSVLRMPINANPTGNFIRGEIVTQATTGATGELLGYVWDTVGSTGWASILPQTGTFNMTTANTITGGTSGATLAPLSGGTLVTLTREVMFCKGSATQVSGTIYYICVDASAESAQLFSTLAVSAGCTATVAPAQGGTSNTFPTKGLVIRGTQGSTSATGFFALTSNFQNYAQIVCVNATPSAGVSADGSFYILLPNSGTTGSLVGFGLQRIDDQEPADPDPYVFLLPVQSTSMSTWVNTTAQTGSTGFISAGNFRQVNQGIFVGYTSRTNPTAADDLVYSYTTYPKFDLYNNQAYAICASTWPNASRLCNHPAPETARPIIFDKFSIYGYITGNPGQFKGRLRWIMISSYGNSLDTFNNRTFLGLNGAGVNVPCYVIGPYDGTSTPQR